MIDPSKLANFSYILAGSYDLKFQTEKHLPDKHLLYKINYISLMSGIEVAGLVLGAFPLAIAAVTEYGEAAKRFRLWYNIGLEHRRCRNDLEFHRVAFVQHLRHLLYPLVSDDDELESLLSDTEDVSWHEKSLDDSLRKRLGESYETYFNYIGSMRQVMQTLNEDLAVDLGSLEGKFDTTVRMA